MDRACPPPKKNIRSRCEIDAFCMEEKNSYWGKLLEMNYKCVSMPNIIIFHFYLPPKRQKKTPFWFRLQPLVIVSCALKQSPSAGSTFIANHAVRVTLLVHGQPLLTLVISFFVAMQSLLPTTAAPVPGDIFLCCNAVSPSYKEPLLSLVMSFFVAMQSLPPTRSRCCPW